MRIVNKSGYSILEVIITLAFLAVVITPMFTLFNSLGIDSYDVRQKTKAYIYASNALEEYVSNDLSSGLSPNSKRLVLGDGFSLEMRQIEESETLRRVEAKVYFKSRQVEENIIVSRVIYNHEK